MFGGGAQSGSEGSCSVAKPEVAREWQHSEAEHFFSRRFRCEEIFQDFSTSLSGVIGGGRRIGGPPIPARLSGWGFPE